MFYGYIVVVNPKPFTSSNSSTSVKTCNCRVHPTSKGQHTQLRTSHLVHSLTLNSNVRGTESTVIGPSYKFFHYFFSCSQAPRLTGSQAHRLTLPGSPNSNPASSRSSFFDDRYMECIDSKSGNHCFTNSADIFACSSKE